MMDYPKPQYFKEYATFLRTQGKAEGTIREYIYKLNKIPDDVETYFSNLQLPGRTGKVAAYRSYLQFLAKKKNELSHENLLNALDTIKAVKARGNGNNEKRKAYPKDEWQKLIRKTPTQVGKFGVYLGFHFGLRLGEILHLRIQDINFDNQEILIRPHKLSKRHKPWNPKYNRERTIPFTSDQEETFKRWINEIRPKDLPNDYLLWTIRGSRKFQIVQDRAFQRWCNMAGLSVHNLRRSFATHWYEETKDIKFVSDMLGHANVSTTSDYLCLGQKESIKKARKYFEQA